MSLFNPWVLLGILMAVVGSFGGGYLKGSNDEVTRQQLEIAALNAVFNHDVWCVKYMFSVDFLAVDASSAV